MIRLATTADAADIAAIYRPAVTESAISFELEPPDATEMAARIDTVLQRTPWLVCCASDGVVGYAYASKHRDRAAYQWSVEVSAYVHADVRRAGVARALYTSLFAILELQGFRNAFAGITLPNDASVAFHRSLGFTDIGTFAIIGYKFGAWHDTGWLGRPLAPHTTDPAPPTPLPEAVSSPGFGEALRSGLPLLRLRTR